MNVYAKQKQTHRYRKPTLVTKGEKEVKGMYGIQTYKLLGLP